MLEFEPSGQHGSTQSLEVQAKRAGHTVSPLSSRNLFVGVWA